MKKYREFQYAIKATKDGWYYGIVYTPDGNDLFYRSKEHRTEYNTYVDIANKVEEFYEKSEQP